MDKKDFKVSHVFFMLFLLEIYLYQVVKSGSCDSPWLDLYAKEYCIVDHTVEKYSTAELVCFLYGGHLVVLHDEKVKKYLSTEILKLPSYPPFRYFIGLKWNGSTFVWADGNDTSTGFTFWAPGQPGDENYVAMGYEKTLNETFPWITVSESSTRAKYICERYYNMNGCSVKGLKCHARATCQYFRGTFICSCLEGYIGNGITCSDHNECSTNSHNCHKKAVCLNRAGSFVCICQMGYTGDGVICSDVDECFLNMDNCHLDAHCTNSNGSFTCACRPGYAGDGINCTDIDECSENTHTCRYGKSCTNFNGTYSCGCEPGYIWKGMECVDFDECATDEHNCAADGGVCINVVGSFNCTCEVGFTGDGFVCTDINECYSNMHNCHRLECINLIGSFTCGCTPGLQWNGTVCIDINECSTMSTNCHSDATCVNKRGSYKCVCDSGFFGNGTSCLDLDECATNSYFCPEHTTCLNKVGTYTCDCGNGLVWNRNKCIATTVFSLTTTVEKSSTTTADEGDPQTTTEEVFYGNSSGNDSWLERKANKNTKSGRKVVSEGSNPASYVFTGAAAVGMLVLVVAVFVARWRLASRTASGESRGELLHWDKFKNLKRIFIKPSKQKRKGRSRKRRRKDGRVKRKKQFPVPGLQAKNKQEMKIEIGDDVSEASQSLTGTDSLNDPLSDSSQSDEDRFVDSLYKV